MGATGVGLDDQFVSLPTLNILRMGTAGNSIRDSGEQQWGHWGTAVGTARTSTRNSRDQHQGQWGSALGTLGISSGNSRDYHWE